MFAAIAISFAGAGQATAGAISINFNGGTKQLSSSTTAGVLNLDHWNNINSANGSGVSLFDSTGATNAATMTYSSKGTWDGATAPQTSSAGTNVLYQGAVYGDPTTPVSVTVSGLTYASYEVYVYWGAGFNASDIMGLTTPVGTFYSVSATQNAGNATSLTQFTSTNSASPTAGDAGYSVFSWSGPSFTVSTLGGNIVTNQIYGIQVNSVPEPSTFALLGLGALGFSIQAYRRRVSIV